MTPIVIKLFRQLINRCWHKWTEWQEVSNSGDSNISEELGYVDYRRHCAACGKEESKRDRPWSRLW
jgi:hypothetical protein